MKIEIGESLIFSWLRHVMGLPDRPGELEALAHLGDPSLSRP